MLRLSVLVCLFISTNLPAQELLITNARIIVGNGEVIENGSINIINGRIESVTEDQLIVSHTREINVHGMTVMPAFIDAHRHIIPRSDSAETWLNNEARGLMQDFLQAGFTTLLSAIDPLDQILALRERINQGDIPGPRLVVAGYVPLAASNAPAPTVDPARVDVSRPHLRPTEPAVAIPPEQTRAMVQRLAEAGVDAIKTLIITTPGGPETETLSVVVDEAERQGILSITHAVSVQDTLAAVEAGTHYLVHTPHIGLLDEASVRRIVDAHIPMTSTLGIFVPTFAETNRHIQQRSGHDNIPRFRDLDPFPMDTLSSAGLGPVNARLLWDAGITYAFGTDTRFHPLDTLRHELVPLKLVFSNQDIITMLTQNAAVAVGLDDELGTLEAGKLADIVILEGDPLVDSHALLDVKTVIKEGVELYNK